MADLPAVTDHVAVLRLPDLAKALALAAYFKRICIVHNKIAACRDPDPRTDGA